MTDRNPVRRGGDRGAVTAEFAVVLPMVIVVLALVLGALALATHRVVLTSTAWEMARLEARGDADRAADRLNTVSATVDVERFRQGTMACLTLTSWPVPGLLAGVSVGATACAVPTTLEHSVP